MRPFIGTNDLAAILGHPVSDTDLITAIALDSGSEAVRSYIGQTINYVENDTEELDGRGRVKIRLKQRPVRNLVSVTLEGEVVDPTEYNRRGATLRRHNGVPWPFGFGNVTVVYSHGWDIIPDLDPSNDFLVPADLRLVALLSARRVYTTVGASAAGTIISESIGSYSYSIGGNSVVQTAAELLPPEQATLERYRIGVMPGR